MIDNSFNLDELRNLPYLNITSPISNVPHLSDLDADLHIPIYTNFDYYSTDCFNNSVDITRMNGNSIKRKAFTALHCNIRSLSANHDNLYHLLQELDCQFSLIGLSETKFKKGKDNFSNFNFDGYDFVHEPSLTNAGGVGFFVENNLTYIIRNDLNNSSIHSEMLWIEVSRPNDCNLVCGIIYRHPSSDFDSFMELFSSTIEKIHREKNSAYLWETST